MNRDSAKRAWNCIAVTVAVGAVVCLALAAYCAAETASFYAGAERLQGTIVGVTDLAGGPAAVVTFVDASGSTHVEQFGPMYETARNEVGQSRTVLYNPLHPIQQAITSPWNWIGSIVYGSAAAALIFIVAVIYLFSMRLTADTGGVPQEA